MTFLSYPQALRDFYIMWQQFISVNCHHTIAQCYFLTCVQDAVKLSTLIIAAPPSLDKDSYPLSVTNPRFDITVGKCSLPTGSLSIPVIELPLSSGSNSSFCKIVTNDKWQLIY